MRYFLAIDAGGTKTDAVVFDETGHIIYRDLSAGNNGMDIGQEAAILQQSHVGGIRQYIPASKQAGIIRQTEKIQQRRQDIHGAAVVLHPHRFFQSACPAKEAVFVLPERLLHSSEPISPFHL